MSLLVLVWSLLVAVARGGDGVDRESVPARPLERPLLLRAGWLETEAESGFGAVRGGFTPSVARYSYDEPVHVATLRIRVRGGLTDWLNVTAGFGGGRVGQARDRRTRWSAPEVEAELRALETLMPTASAAIRVGATLDAPLGPPWSDGTTAVPALRAGVPALRADIVWRYRTGPFRVDASVNAVARLPALWSGEGVDLGDGIGTVMELLLQIGPVTAEVGGTATHWTHDRVGDRTLGGGWTVVGNVGSTVSLNRVLDLSIEHDATLRRPATWWELNPTVSAGWGGYTRLAVIWRH